MVVLTVSEFNILGFSRGGDSVLGLTLGLDLEGGTHLVYRVVPEDGREPTQDDMEGVRNIIDKRVNSSAAVPGPFPIECWFRSPARPVPR